MDRVQNLKEWIKLMLLLIVDFFPSSRSKTEQRLRKRCDSSIVYVEIHEWGGYGLSREKNVHLINPFMCGLKYQLERFSTYMGKREINVTVTMSDVYRHDDVEYVKKNCDELMETSNAGKDFAGYAAFFDSIKDKGNAYVILTNSSVNAKKTEFIDDYIEYMENNPDVGMLGISYNSRCYQSLVRNNFTPHLQSFFLLTTIDVLKQIVEHNRGRFPGSAVCNKRLLIREGEIKLSQIALSIGYNLAVVQEDGVHKFNNDPCKWTLKRGDSRICCQSPNMIWPLK